VGQVARPAEIGLRRRAQAFLAADVGGTHARVATVRIDAGAAEPVTVSNYRKYVCADYAGLDLILEDFLSQVGDDNVDAGAIACAGYALDGNLINANLPWGVQLAPLRQRLGLRDLALVNDFEAVAYATQFVASDDSSLMTGRADVAPAPVLIVGPGTGLGAALRIPAANGVSILATEAGHASLAPGNALELAILERLLKRSPHVANEHLLSGPGLLTLYTALCDVRGAKPTLATPAAITASAQSGADALAVEALEVFCGLLGSVVGDLVLLYRAEGGVYLAGGIPAQIKPFLLRSRFVERFLNKGPLRALLETVPVWLIDHGQLGVIGAATWYAQHHPDSTDSNATAAGARR
jgi:glucokinase